jgi:hypothetical protein
MTNIPINKILPQQPQLLLVTRTRSARNVQFTITTFTRYTHNNNKPVYTSNNTYLNRISETHIEHSSNRNVKHNNLWTQTGATIQQTEEDSR